MDSYKITLRLRETLVRIQLRQSYRGRKLL